jgi:serpin B
MATTCSWSPAASPGSDPTPIRVQDAREAATASNRFGFDLYARVSGEDRNVIVSPLSASVALSMTAAGARGETLAQMSRVLHVSELEDAHRSFGELLTGFPTAPDEDVAADAGATADARGQQPGDPIGPVLEGGRLGRQPEVSVANRIWAQSGYPFRDEYLSLLRDRYGVSLGLFDFAHDPTHAAAQINDWVDARTRHRIPDLLPLGAIDEYVRLVLVNAIHFKADWQSPFVAAWTHPEAFATPHARAEVPTMQQTAYFSHAELDDVQLVELPYVGNKLSMVVVLPDSKDGLRDAETRIGRSYDRWLAALKSREVDLWLPRWTARQTHAMNAVLTAMGMPLAFDGDRADFSGMTGARDLYISLVLQKAFAETTEQGTEAAAATAVVMSVPVMAVTYSKPPPPPVVFHADHPFLYVIRDRSTGAILFVGRVTDPR